MTALTRAYLNKSRTQEGGTYLHHPIKTILLKHSCLLFSINAVGQKAAFVQILGRYLPPFSLAVELLVQYDGTKGDFGDLLSEPVGFRL